MASMNDESPIQKFVKFSFIPINDVMQVSYSKQKDLIANALQSHPYFSKIGHIWQTLEKGVNFPVIHYLKLNNIDNKFQINESDGALGADFILHEVLYEEIQRIQLPVIACNINDSSGTSCRSSPQSDRVYLSKDAHIFVGFKTLDTTFNSVLEDCWQDWSGARSLYLNLSSDFGLSKICFYRRILPNELNTFMYILIAQCTNVNDKNRVLLLDYVDRFRLQRLCGYLTVYSRFSDIKPNSSSSSIDSSEPQSLLNQELANDSLSITPVDI